MRATPLLPGARPEIAPIGNLKAPLKVQALGWRTRSECEYGLQLGGLSRGSSSRSRCSASARHVAATLDRLPPEAASDWQPIRWP
jgi:hypothetical protein